MLEKLFGESAYGKNGSPLTVLPFEWLLVQMPRLLCDEVELNMFHVPKWIGSRLAAELWLSPTSLALGPASARFDALTHDLDQTCFAKKK